MKKRGILETHKSRTSNSVRNASITTITQVVGIVVSFINRTLFIHYLGIDYLSVNGLFVNILAILSFAELGIGSAITFTLYKPISDKNNDKINAILNIYRKAYRWIAIAITVLGLSVIPFLSSIVKDVPSVKYNLVLLYLLFLSNTVASYIYSYKKAVISADQKDYIVTLYQQSVTIAQSVVLLLILVYSGNYVLYLITQIGCTIVNNILISKKANKLYPFIEKPNQSKLSKDEKNTLFNNIKAIFLYKLGSVVLTGTDNIVISVILKTQLVGLVSNYTLIINSINGVVSRAIESIGASIGNLNVSLDHNQKKHVFDELFFITFWIFSLCSICLVLLLNPFIQLWVGAKYLCPPITSIALVSTFYVLGLNIIPSQYRTTLGYFRQVRYTPVLAAIINLILSVILGKTIGLSGIVFATTISRLATYSMVDPITIYRKHFKLSPFEFYGKYFLYTLIMTLGYFIAGYFVLLIKHEGFLGFILKGVVCLAAVNAFYYVLFFKTKTFKAILSRVTAHFSNKNKQ